MIMVMWIALRRMVVCAEVADRGVCARTFVYRSLAAIHIPCVCVKKVVERGIRARALGVDWLVKPPEFYLR